MFKGSRGRSVFPSDTVSANDIVYDIETWLGVEENASYEPVESVSSNGPMAHGGPIVFRLKETGKCASRPGVCASGGLMGSVCIFWPTRSQQDSGYFRNYPM